MSKNLVLDIGRVLGKRQMLFELQLACRFNGGTLTLDDINKYSEICELLEEIYPVDKYALKTDVEIREESKRIANQKKGVLQS
jgi:hypothetical protein